MADYHNLDFSVTDTPPDVKRTGRRGSNPFVEPLRKSYEGNFAAANEWYEFTVDLDGEDEPKRAVMRMVDRIRAAGQSQNPKIGTEVRADYETGRVAFRGVEWEPRKSKGADDGDGRHALNDPYEGAE